MTRENISMTSAEVMGFLRRARWVAVGSLNPQGHVDTEPAACLLDGDRLVLCVPSTSRAALNIAEDGRIACALDEFPSYYEIKGVTVHGVARPSRVSDLPQAIGASLTERAMALGLEAGDLAYAVPLDDAFGFDFGKIQARLD